MLNNWDGATNMLYVDILEPWVNHHPLYALIWHQIPWHPRWNSPLFLVFTHFFLLLCILNLLLFISSDVLHLFFSVLFSLLLFSVWLFLFFICSMFVCFVLSKFQNLVLYFKISESCCHQLFFTYIGQCQAPKIKFFFYLWFFLDFSLWFVIFNLLCYF